MNRRDFLVSSSSLVLSGAIFAQSWWPTSASEGAFSASCDAKPRNNSNKPLVAIPFAIAGVSTKTPKTHRAYIPLVVTE